MSKPKTEKEIYRQQGIELAQEAKLSLIVPSSVILNTDDDFVLGQKVREMYQNKIQGIEEYINHMKTY